MIAPNELAVLTVGTSATVIDSAGIRYVRAADESELRQRIVETALALARSVNDWAFVMRLNDDATSFAVSADGVLDPLGSDEFITDQSTWDCNVLRQYLATANAQLDDGTTRQDDR